MKKSISTPVLIVLFTMILPACTSTPPSSNTLIVPTTDNSYLMAKGMWKDPNTGLIWDRCNAGQTWNGTTCVGTALKLNRDDIWNYVRDFTSTGGHNDWRLPLAGELASLRVCTAGWEKEPKKISELTAQGRVTQDVNIIKTLSLPVAMINKNYNGRDERDIPNKPPDGSSRPTLNTNIFPNTPTDGRYFSSPPNGTSYSPTWNLHLGNGNIEYNNVTDTGRKNEGYVRAVRGSK